MATTGFTAEIIENLDMVVGFMGDLVDFLGIGAGIIDLAVISAGIIGLVMIMLEAVEDTEDFHGIFATVLSLGFSADMTDTEAGFTEDITGSAATFLSSDTADTEGDTVDTEGDRPDTESDRADTEGDITVTSADFLGFIIAVGLTDVDTGFTDVKFQCHAKYDFSGRITRQQLEVHKHHVQNSRNDVMDSAGLQIFRLFVTHFQHTILQLCHYFVRVYVHMKVSLQIVLQFKSQSPIRRNPVCCTQPLIHP